MSGAVEDDQDVRDAKAREGTATVGSETVATDEGPETLPSLPPGPPNWGRRPNVLMSRSADDGSFVGIMHLGTKVRAFMGETVERMHTQIAKIGIGEFGMTQADADDLVANTAAAQGSELSGGDQPEQPAPTDEAQQDVQRLRDENDSLRQQLQAAEDAVSSAQRERDKVQSEFDDLRQRIGLTTNTSRPQPRDVSLGSQEGPGSPGSTDGASQDDQTGDGSTGTGGEGDSIRPQREA